VQKTKTVAEAGQNTVSGNVVTTPVGYVKSERKTTVGTAEPGATITPGTADHVFPAGTYLTGALTVKGDADLVAENIAEGKEIFGIAGSFKGGSSMDFYKCASVDATAKTWTGYKAVFADGVYSFEESVTSGLTYTAITPVIGRVYTADALCEIKKLFDGSLIPTEGQVFYAPLAQASTTAETGQALTTSGNVTYSTVDGIPCAYFQGSSCGINFPDAGFPAGSSARSVSLWCKNAGNTSQGMLFGYGTQTTSQMVNIALRSDGSVTNSIYADDSNMVIVYPDTDKWFNIVLTYDGNTETMYLNGVAGSTTSKTFNTRLSNGWIGHYGSQDYCPKAYLASVRVYDRVLTDDEIQQLAGEFNV
jgi:hypothetical protein